MPTLQLWNDYTREDVHGIFAPGTVFTPQAGTWGLQGMVRIPERIGDWVFFVTFGQEQGAHVFDESITADGVLSWQSQPAQKLADAAIKELINLDDRVNNIHLFLRTKKKSKYSYLGTLGYLTHDAVREQPVHFQWQLLDWPAPNDLLQRIDLKLLNSEVMNSPELLPAEKSSPLSFVDPPAKKVQREGVTTDEFRTRKTPDYAKRDERNRQMGLSGELIVLEYEQRRLRDAGRDDLANQIVHVSVTEGDVAGYDIRSYEIDGTLKYIEVKTTAGPAHTNFFITPNELSFSARNSEQYFLYRLFDFDDKSHSAKTFVIRGDVSNSVNLVPTAYRASI